MRVYPPDGAYYVMVDIGGLAREDEDDVAFALRITASPGVASVPGSSFYSRPELGRGKIRFAFPKREETLAEAARRLASLA
jgi:aminotransferase